MMPMPRPSDPMSGLPLASNCRQVLSWKAMP
jgi:hypothetical protein